MIPNKLQLLVGPPGSGKSTYAKNLEKQGFSRISQDDLGKEEHLNVFNESLREKRDICIDRMDFTKEQRQKYISKAKELGYETEIVIFYEPYESCLDRILKRENHPTIKDEDSAKSALKMFFSKYEKVETIESDKITEIRKNDSEKDLAIIVDLDGTLVNCNHRLHFIRNGQKKEWDKFFGSIEYDVPNTWCAVLVNSLFRDNRKITYCTGRPEKYREQTTEWLKRYSLWEQCDNNLYMRTDGDYSSDIVTKEKLLDFEILTRFNPMLFIDDRKPIVDMFSKRGFKTLYCGIST